MTDALDAAVDALVAGPPHARPQREKEEALLALLGPAAARMAAALPAYGRFLEKSGPPPSAWRSLADAPPLPVSVFKRFALAAVPPSEVVRELRSSSTTSQRPSRIFVDKKTAFRQARALATVLKDHVGSRRRPYLVLDAPESAAAGPTLVARGAAIRGLEAFATETVFGARLGKGGEVEPDFDAVARFFERHRGGSPLVFGFTFLVFSRFVREAERRGLRFDAPEAVLLHSGGWKKLLAEAVSKDEFTRRTSAVFGMPGRAVLDFYGLVEQVGTVFVDCEAGNKHAPAWADVLVRRPLTLARAEPGETGLIEVVSVLPSSYPGLALLTEDEGVVTGVDDCPCGRRGTAFRFVRRVERAALRGCGDVYAAREGS